MKNKVSKRILSILFAMVMLVGLLPTAAMAAIRDPIVEIPTTLSFKTEPQSGSALKTEGYAYTWALNKAADMIVLEIKETNRLTGASSWEQLATLTGTSGSGSLTYPVLENRRPNDQSEYRISAIVAGKTLEDSELASCTFIVTWMGLQTFTVTVKDGTGSGEYAPGAAVTVTADQSGEGWQFLKWSGLEGLPITKGSATTETVTFTMPLQAVELTAVYQSIAQGPTLVRPAKGDGTSGNPFQITNEGELYWFAAFVNDTASYPDDVTVERSEACAILMNDITVNPNLLNTDGTLIGAYGFERWIPIGYYSKYSGTFEGQGYTISGLYFDHGVPYTKYRDIGFVANLDDGGCVRLLTIADSWFATPSAATDFYLGGIAGYVGDGSIVGCSFRGVIKANTDYYLNSVGGIAGVNNGTIDDCWVMGWVKAYSTYGAGGIVGSAGGTVKNSLNYAEVINTLPTSTEGGSYSGTGGIVGVLCQGTVRDCRNSGIIGGNHFVGGIAGQAYGFQSKQALINRCYNDANVGGGGIVGRLGDSTPDSATANGYVTIKNCYNKGSVIYGICEYANGSGNSISYCHNVGVFTQQPILGGAAADSSPVVEHCYYKGSSEIDSIGGTAYKTAEEFANGTVLALMDNGNWEQGSSYPVLGEVKGVTQPTLALKVPTLEFKDMITVNVMFTAENTEDVVEMGMLTYSSNVSSWSVETAEHVIPGTTYDANTGRYIAHSQGIHAKYLGDSVYMTVYAKLTDGSYVYCDKLAPYSPVQYATNQLAKSTDTKLKQLCAAMLNYGAEAQLFFGHNTGSLANASLTAEQKALPAAYDVSMTGSVPAASAAKQGAFANNQGFAKRTPSISFEGAFCINYFFTPAYAPDNGITLYYWNAEDFNANSVLTTANATGSVKMSGSGTGEYRGDITGISAKDLSEAVYVSAVYESGGTTWTSGVLGYTIGSYCASQISKGAAVAALAKATAVYGYHAKQYFG